MKFYLSIVLVLCGVNLSFADIMAVSSNSAEIRDSSNPYIAQVVLVVPRNYPLTILSATGDYYQVRDFSGREGWIEKGSMDSVKSVVVKVRSGNIRTGPGTEHEIHLRANRGVAFRVLEEKTEWLRVEHESGRQGWIHKMLVWGS